MKNTIKYIIIVIFISISTNIFAQSNPDTTYWDIGGIVSLTGSQVHLKYWTAGGDNSLGMNSLFSIHANYLKNKISWKNSFETTFGTQRIGKQDYRKIDDKIDFSSKFGYKAINKFYYTGLFSFKTQYFEGFEYDDDNNRTKISDFLAPGYLLYSAGIDYLPSEYFSIYTSPLTGKTTIVNNDSLASVAAFGVDTAQTFRHEFGAYIKFEFSKEVWENVTITSKLDFFSNYQENPQNIDVNFDLLLAMKINKYLTVNLTTQLIYDDDIKILIDPDTGHKGSRLQVKEVLGVGLMINF